jgi:hypothetical protein
MVFESFLFRCMLNSKPFPPNRQSDCVVMTVGMNPECQWR